MRPRDRGRETGSQFKSGRKERQQTTKPKAPPPASIDAASVARSRKRTHAILREKPEADQHKSARRRPAFITGVSSVGTIKPPKAHGPQLHSLEQSFLDPNQKDLDPSSHLKGHEHSSHSTEKESSIESSKISTSRASRISDLLPENICKQYSALGKKDNLFEWQSACLASPGVLNGHSIVFCAPTSAGKSLVAEILLLRSIIATEKAGMLVLPFVALCAEKALQLEVLLKPLQRKVRRFYGTQSSQSVFGHDTGILVCTIEKANALVNRMIEEDILDGLGIVVVDELHMVNDPHRGYLLELMLSKLRFISTTTASPSTECLQFVGMSATLPNGDEVAQWLGAELFITDTRPVPLKQFLKVGTTIMDPSGNEVRTLQPPDDWNHDVDHVGWLTKETVDSGHSVLIFCCSRKACEICAKEISEIVDIPVTNPSKSEHRNMLIKELGQIVGEHRQALSELIPKGMAFHHAGLSSEERRLVERAYKNGAVSVLTATSTLAAGVNLPARRVIFREPYVGIPSRVLDSTTYRQMAGRAGRAGIDDEGEAYLLESKEVQTEKLRRLIQSDAQPVSSCLSSNHDGMIRLLLEVVSNNAVHTQEDVDNLIRSTLLAHVPSTADDAASIAAEALTWLTANHLISRQDATEISPSQWCGCPLGEAIVSAGMDPRECAVVRDDLEKAMNHLVLSSDLHLSYLVTPYHNDIPVDWEKLFCMTVRLSKTDACIADLLGICMAFLQKKSMGLECRDSANEERTAKRFYVALILRDFISEVPMAQICQKFNLSHGTIEALQEKSLIYASMSSTFCGCLGWVNLQVVITEFQKRIHGGARPEIVHLTEIPYVNAQRARRLNKAGFRSVEAIADLNSIERLATALMFGRQSDGQSKNLFIARKIARGAQRLLREKLASIEETKAALDVVAGDDTIESQDIDEYQSREEKCPSDEPLKETECLISSENELSLSLRRLNVDSMSFAEAEGIVFLDEEADIRSLCRYLSGCEHISIISHFEEDSRCPTGIAVSWTENTVVYARILDQQFLNHFTGILGSMEIQKSTFRLDESLSWITQLLHDSSPALHPSFIDVREAARLLKESEPALNDLAGLFLIFGLEDIYQEIKRSLSGISPAPCMDFHVLTCCSAAALTRKLWSILKRKLEEEQLMDYFLQIQMPYIDLIESLSHNGVQLDRHTISTEICQTEARIIEASKVCQYFSRIAIDPSSDRQVENMLFSRLKVKRPHPGCQLDEQILRQLQDQHPFAAAVLHYRWLADIHECLAMTLENNRDSDDVCLQGDVFVQVFRSWMEDEQMVMLSLPIHEVKLEENFIHLSPVGFDGTWDPTDVKRCIIPSQGALLVTAEYLHLDVWLLAHFSQDQKLISALLRSNGDPFKAIVAATQNIPDHQTSDILDFYSSYFQRFLIGYLSGSGTLLNAHLLNVNEQQAQQSYDDFCRFFQGVATWMGDLFPKTSLPTEIRTIHDRRILLQHPSTVQLALRSIIQGSIADIVKHASVQIMQKLMECFPSSILLYRRNQELVFEVNKSDREEAISIIRDSMKESAKMNVPAPIMVKIESL